MHEHAHSFGNNLLIALPSLQDSDFARSVTLICQHDGDGAMGVVVNRPSEYTLGEVLQQMGISSDSESLQSQIVLAGGPVHPERGFVLHDGDREWDSTLAVGGGLYLTTSRDVLEALARGEGPTQAVVALGCAGWGAGQLEQESSGVREQVSRVLVDLQFQDRVSQILTQIEQDIARLDVRLGEDRQVLSGGSLPQPIDSGGWLKQFESGYTTLEQHDAGGRGAAEHA